VDYESLAGVGSIMGSGGLIVMDDTSCMVDVARYFMEFCRDESCGKCIPCRAGTVQMHGILHKITDGSATLEDLALLEQLAQLLKDTSLCGLGQTAPNPVVSTLRYFRDEYMAHIVEKRCPAGVCPMAPAAAAPSLQGAHA
jgi:bidirectional [NiFe] hydrogenase diaphorase subunit